MTKRDNRSLYVESPYPMERKIMEDHEMKRDSWWYQNRRAEIAWEWLKAIGWLLIGFLVGLLF